MNIIQKALNEGRRWLSEHESKEVLKAYNVPVVEELEVASTEEVQEAASRIKFPWVMKGCSPTLQHKTEKDLVRMNIRGVEEACSVFQELMAKVQQEQGSVLINEMLKGKRELMIGFLRDRQFGPCVMFGLGGILTEILQDVLFKMAPLRSGDALEMLGNIKAAKILENMRGMPAADVGKIADILVNLGRLGCEQESIAEIDINPVILEGPNPVAVDALIVFQPKD